MNGISGMYKSNMTLQDFSQSTEAILPDEPAKKEDKGSWLPTRYILAVLGFGGFFIAYALRVNLSVALVAMVNRTNEEDLSSNDSHCPVDEDSTYNNSSTPTKEGEFNWSQDIQGQILASFFYGYVITQVPGGRLAEKFGSKWFFGIGILSTAILSILSPVAARLNVYFFLAIRVFEGLAEGVTFPAMHSMLARWLPKYERGMLTTIVYSGSQVGTVVTMPIAGLLADSNFLQGWPSVFYVFGALGCLWFVFWSILAFESPSEHPRIHKSELKFITENQEKEMTKKPPIPWKQIALSPAVWAITLTHFGQNWGFYTLLTYLPTYFQTILHMDIKQNGKASSLPYVMQSLFAWTSGYIGDLIRKKGYASVNTIRKTANSIAFFGPALCLLGVTFAKCDHNTIIALMSLAMGFNGLIYSGFMVTHVDMSPDFAGTLMGITNGFGNTAGFLAPMALSKIIKHHETSLERWSIVFYLAAAVYIAGALIFIFLGSAELQPWGIASRDQEEGGSQTGSDISDKKLQSGPSRSEPQPYTPLAKSNSGPQSYSPKY